METLGRFFRKLRIFIRVEKFSRELEEEMAFHRAESEKEFRAEGMAAEDARHAANRQFGNDLRLKERSHEVVGFRCESFLQDLRFALRQLRKNPGFACTAILVLALGIGATVTIFAFADAALLQPLPYTNPTRLMSVNESSIERLRWPLSYPDYVDWQLQNKSFISLSVYGGTVFLMRTASGTEPVRGARVSGNFFQTLGVHPLLGRDFSPNEDRLGGPNVVLLTYSAWLHRFGARPDVVGQTIDLDNKAEAFGYTIIGVLPREFSFAPSGNADLWIPINSLSGHEHSRTFYNFWGIGRLRDGVTVQTATAEMTAIAKQLQKQYSITGRGLSASIVPLSEIIVGDVRPILLMLLSGAGLLWLIACVNVSSLVLARSESRRREVAMRGALGATHARLVRQFVTEGLLLALFGCLAGMIIASGLMKLLAGFVPKDMASGMPFLGDVGLNRHIVISAAITTLIAALLSAATPILRLSSRKIRDELAESDRGAASRLWRRLGANLVVVELAIAVVLLAAAGLLGQSLYRLLHVPLGFDPGHLATMRVMVSGSGHNNNEQMAEIYEDIARRVSGLPGVHSVGMTSLLPVQCNCSIDSIHFLGKPYHGEHNDVDERHVSPDYLRTLKAGLVRGRFFTETDDASRPGVAVINQSLARKYFPGQDPIGQKIVNDEGGHPSTWEIIGVVEDVREGPLDVDVWPAEYFPLNQTGDHSFNLVVRTLQDAWTVLPALTTTLQQIDPNLVVSDETTMNDKIGGTQAAILHRFAAWLVGGFAATALVLGVVGLYGVVAYSVSQRTREIGVRMALGAQRSSVYRLVLGEAGWLAVFGIVTGLALSIAAATLMRKLLFGVEAWDAPTLAGVAVVLGGSALLASYIPARRAASVNPVEALRAE